MIGRREVIVGGSVVAAAAVARAATSMGGDKATANSADVTVVNGGPAASAAPAASATPDPLLIQTTTGKFRGKLVENTSIRSFTNVRFGRSPAPNYNNSTAPDAPTGRFKPPVAAPYSEVEQNATTDAPWPVGANGGGLEDCLKLNIWTPSVAPPAGGWPVLVYIFGGGNIGGGIAWAPYAGETFAARGVICVCINYRVGPLGFLELGGLQDYATLAGSGNNGIRDQVLGLQWVKDNIAKFNGNPNRVTIAGQSAGAGDVTTLYTLPAARGLFQRAIIVSGGGGQLNETSVAESYGAAFVDELRNPKQNVPDPATAAGGPLFATQAQLVAAYKNTQNTMGFTWTATKQDGFITEDPIKTVENTASAMPVPLMIGYRRDEIQAGVFPDTVILDNIPIPNYNYNFFPNGSAAWDLYQDIFDTDEHHQRVAFFTADKFKVPAIAIAQAAVRHGQPNVYVYEDRYLGRAGATKTATIDYAVHGGDIPFYFNHLDTEHAKKYGYTTNEQTMANKVQTAWVRFIWGLSMQMDNNQWVPYTASARNMMIIDAPSQMASDPISEERNAWVQLGAIKP